MWPVNEDPGMSDDKQHGDQAFRNSDATGTWVEMTYGGALSFARRRYSRDLAGVDLVVSGIPYDNAVTYRSGCRLGPRAIRAGSVQLAELKHFPFGFDPFDTLSVVDYGDAFIDPHHPAGVFDSIEAHADHILASGAMMLSLGGDHSVAYPLLRRMQKNTGQWRWCSLMRIAIPGRMMAHALITARCLPVLRRKGSLMSRAQHRSGCAPIMTVITGLKF